MRFHDYTLLEGRVHSRRVQDTEQLSAPAVELAGDLLRRAQDCIEVEHGLSGLPPFYVRLGLPPEYPEAPGSELVFCVGVPGQPPFQFNAVLHPDSEREPALYALATVFGVSCVGGERPTPHQLDETEHSPPHPSAQDDQGARPRQVDAEFCEVRNGPDEDVLLAADEAQLCAGGRKREGVLVPQAPREEESRVAVHAGP